MLLINEEHDDNGKLCISALRAKKLGLYFWWLDLNCNDESQTTEQAETNTEFNPLRASMQSSDHCHDEDLFSMQIVWLWSNSWLIVQLVLTPYINWFCVPIWAHNKFLFFDVHHISWLDWHYKAQDKISPAWCSATSFSSYPPRNITWHVGRLCENTSQISFNFSLWHFYSCIFTMLKS